MVRGVDCQVTFYIPRHKMVYHIQWLLLTSVHSPIHTTDVFVVNYTGVDR